MSSTEKLYNVGLISHSGAGKTSLAESMLYFSGATTRLGSVDQRNSILDFDPEERERQVSINAAVAPISWRGHRINVFDTPGYFDFVGEVRAALRASDVALITVEGVSGVEVGTELVWGYADEYEMPRAVFVNKLDRENADFYQVLDQIRQYFPERIAPLQLPIGREGNFSGVVDLMQMKAYHFGEKGTPEEVDIPEDMVDEVEQYREELLDAVVERDDELLMMYLEGEEIEAEVIGAALKGAVAERELVPVLCGSAISGTGVVSLMDAIIDYFPAPDDLPPMTGTDPETDEEIARLADVDEPFSALVFKTMADPYVGRLTLFRVRSGRISSDSEVLNSSQGAREHLGQLFIPRGNEQTAIDEAVAGDIVAVAKLQATVTGDTLCSADAPIVYPRIRFPEPVYHVAIQPESRGDEEKIGSGLRRLAEEDATFKVERNSETNEQILSGMGELHISVILDRMKRKFGVGVTTSAPKIAYRETIRRQAAARYRHKKQTGGRGQFGEVDLRLEPLPRGEEFEFVDEIFGGSVPNQFIPAVEKGVREAMVEGPVASCPVTDVRVALYDGGYHPVDSSEMAFKVAGSMAFKQAFMEADPVLLEPVMDVSVRVPEEYMGDVIGDLNRKRGKILGMEPEGRSQIIKAKVPAAEMSRYAIDLRSITQGRGTYTMTLSSYEVVPA
ncbi:MAG: elongation factor G, partial [Bacillota bacterium]